MTKVNKCEFTFFSSADWRDARKKWNLFVQKNASKKIKNPQAINIKIAAYFDENRSVYKVCLVGTFGDIIKKEISTWDELSNFIRNNI